MKASFRFILAALAATAALVGCTKEITPNFENDKVNPEGSRIIAVSFAPQTKTTLDGLQPKFEDGKDTVLISNTNALDTCVVSVKDNKATISTNLTGPLTAVYPYTAAGMSEDNGNEIDTVLVSTVQSGKFADANICMAKMTGENEESLSFENKTAVFCIKPAAGASSEYVEVKAEGFNIANDYPEGSTHTSLETIHVNTTSADSVYVSILVPKNLTVGNLTFSDGTNVKTIKDERASTAIAAGTLYTVTNANWESTEADIPEPLKGVFTVSDNGTPTDTTDDIKVHFSQGNLRYIIGTKEWGFYEHQYDFCNTTTYNGHHSDTISLFTCGYDAEKSVVPDGTGYVEGHTTDGETFDKTEDWGFVFEGESSIWRTLTRDEWCYLFAYNPEENNFITTSPRYPLFKTGVTVCGSENCVVLLPDNWDGTVISLTDFAAQNTYDESSNPKWSEMEAAGAVCLPAAGIRNGSEFSYVGNHGNYWSSTASDSSRTYGVGFYSSFVYPGNDGLRSSGYSVRLVTDVSAAPGPEQSLVLGPDMIIMKMKGSESKPGIDNVTYPWIEYVNPNSTLDDGTAEVLFSNRWTNLDPATGDIGDGTNWIQVTGKNGSANSPVINPQLGTYFIFTVQNIYGMQVFATGSASGSEADNNCLKLTATSGDGEVIEASSTPGGIYGKGTASDVCTINLNPKKSYSVKVEAAVKAIQITGIKLINEIP